ncbi:MAG: hypothetical protein LBC02_00850 [Planctomycetaceae bacterium]|nr:hypothetical protein [Planctomycetaceae bacterium]
MNKNVSNGSDDRVRSSMVLSYKMHRRIRELTGFEHGGFTRFLEASLELFLPLVETYYEQHKNEIQSCSVLRSLRDDTDLMSEYEAIGRAIVKKFHERKKGGFHNGK